MAEATDFGNEDCIGVKVLNPERRMKPNCFMLKYVMFNSPRDLHAVITEQLGSKTVAHSSDFEVG